MLVALPILATADAVARVFQQRTGDLVRPLPWAIMLPMVVGLVACAAGVSLSAMSLVPPNRPYALVATALVASGLMIFVARRTGQQAFVWATLFGLTCVYQFSPMFFMQIVIALRDRGAELVGEQRLPFAFYGLTYFPLLAGLLIEAYRL